MVFGFGSTPQLSPWDKVDAAVEELLASLRDLQKALEPEPAQMGILGAGAFGRKAEFTRKAIDKLTDAIAACAAAQPDGRLQRGQVESVMQRIDANSDLMVGVLEKVSTDYYRRFRQIGMGVPSIVKASLSWIESSTKACIATIEKVNKTPELVDDVSRISNKLLGAQADALTVYTRTA